MSLALIKETLVTVARVSGITGEHAAANGDYFFTPDFGGVWLKDGSSGDFNQTIKGYAITNVDAPLGAGWVLSFANLTPPLTGQTGGAPVANPWEVVAWGDAGLFTAIAGTETISVDEATAPAVPMSIGKSELSNPLLPTEIDGPVPNYTPPAKVSPGATTPEPTLSPGSPGTLVPEV